MAFSLIFQIAKTHLLSKKKQTITAMLGVTFGIGMFVLMISVMTGVNDYLSNYKRRSILDLEDAVGKTVVFRPEPTYPIDVVHYRFLTGDGQPARIAIPAGLGVKA